jgi:hypothetical protein
MSELHELYERIAAGAAIPRLPDATTSALLDRAKAAVEDPSGDWDAALRVAVTIGGWRAANLLRDAVRGGDFERAALALEWAPYAGRDGEAALSHGLDLDDEALLLQALSLLSAHQARAGTGRARRLLDHASVAVRGAAAGYLGLVAGPAVYGEIRTLLGQPELTGVAQLAMDRLDGVVERPEAAPWPSLALDAVEAVEQPAERPPEELPPEPGALLVLLGRAAAEHREGLVEAVEACSPALVAAAIRPLVATSPVDQAVGACVLTRLRADPRWRLPVRRLMGHADPRVRVAAARALELMGASVDRPALERASGDPSALVRQAASAALAAIEAREA